MTDTYYLPDPSAETRFSSRSRPLIHAFIISVALNLGLVASFTYFILKEKKMEALSQENSMTRHPKPLSVSNAEILEKFSEFSFMDLVQALSNESLIEQGYRYADLALACLVRFHHFDLERALPGVKIQKRLFSFFQKNADTEIEMDLVTGLDTEHLHVIRNFARHEKWPLTSKGLFAEMQWRKEQISESLKETFFLSREFYLLERAFEKFPLHLQKDTLLTLLLQGTWNQIEEITKEIQKTSGYEIHGIGAFLARYDSQLAAYLLIVLDPEYAFVKLSNGTLQNLIEKLTDQTHESEIFLRKVALSLRPNEIRELAEKQLLAWGSNMSLEPESKENSEIQYVVQRGDSLWSLSKKFKITMNTIRETNHLTTDTLKPGQVLEISSN